MNKFPEDILKQAVILFSLLVLTSQTVYPQNVLEEIVVTATKRGQVSIQDTAIAIQALSDEMLDRRGVVEFADWAYAVPGLEFRDNGPGDKQYIVRGVASRAASPVGVYFNEAVLTANNTTNEGGGRNAEIKLYDIERIEVLKGPQGTLYGANSMAGTVKIISKQPQFNEFDSYVEGLVSTTEKGSESYNGSAMLNMPVIDDQLALRLVGWYENNGGYIDQIRHGVKDANEEDTYGARLQLRYEPADYLRFNVMALYQDTEVDDVSRYTKEASLTPPAPPLDTIAGGPALAATRIPGGDLVNHDYVFQPWEDKSEIYSFQVEWDIGQVTLTGATNWYDRENLYGFDSASTDFTFRGVGYPFVSTASFPQERSLWSNEIRLASQFDGRFNFVLGGYTQVEEADYDVEIVVSGPEGRRLPFNPNTEGYFGPGTGKPGNAAFGRTLSYSLFQSALFGELTFDFTDRVSIQVGGRFFWSDQEIEEQAIKPIGAIGAGPVLNTDFTSNRFTPKVSFSYDVTEDAMLYFTYAEGFRVGGINQRTPFAPIPPSYNPDNLSNLEAGWKTTWMDRRLTLNGSVYWINWEDIQIVQADAITGIFNFVSNGGEARIRGLEMQADFIPVANWEFSAALAYTDAKIVEDQPQIFLGPPVPLIRTPLMKGDDVPGVPEFSATLFTQYSRALAASGLELAVSGDISYVGSSSTEGNARNPFNRETGDYAVVNVRAAILRQDAWSITAFLDNAFDKRAIVDIIADSQNPDDITTIRPRTFGIRTRLDF